MRLIVSTEMPVESESDLVDMPFAFLISINLSRHIVVSFQFRLVCKQTYLLLRTLARCKCVLAVPECTLAALTYVKVWYIMCTYNRAEKYDNRRK